MPITNTRDLIPFVNQLEQKLLQITSEAESWTINKSQVLSAIPQVERNRVNAISAIVKAEDALAEINTATFGVVATKGQKLKKLLDSLKTQVIEIAENAKGKGGAEPYIRDEVNSAIAAVDSSIPDGFKLDFRLRRIQEMAQQGIDFKNKEVIMPYKVEYPGRLVTDMVQVDPEEGIEFVDGGVVTVLDGSKQTGILGSNNSMIGGRINDSGVIVLDEAPMQPCVLYFPVRMAFHSIPEDFLYYVIDMVIAKNSPMMEMLLKFEQIMSSVVSDIAYMKGENWTVDHSIMRNHKDWVMEAITPKGLAVSVQDGMAHLTFSYNDHPHLSHFVAEKLNAETNEWEPVNENGGVISK